jgi:hypothetical protein
MAKSRINRKLDRFAKYFAIAAIMIIGAVMQFRWVANNQSVKNPFKPKFVKKALCTHCDGRGIVPFFLDPSEPRECPICYGAGVRLVKINPEFQQSCPSCFGMGRLYNTDTHHGVTCYTCVGRGAILRGDLMPYTPTESDTNAAPEVIAAGDPDDV